MNGEQFFLDTNIIIYLFNGDRRVANMLHQKTLFVSVITEMELLSFPDLQLKERERVKEFLQQTTILELNQPLKELAIQIRSEFRLKLPDAIVLASAQLLDVPLFTADKRLKKVTSADVIIYDPAQ